MATKQLILTGAYEGQDVAVGSIQFVKGVSQRLSEADAAAAMTFVPGRLDGLECKVVEVKRKAPPKKEATPPSDAAVAPTRRRR